MTTARTLRWIVAAATLISTSAITATADPDRTRGPYRRDPVKLDIPSRPVARAPARPPPGPSGPVIPPETILQIQGSALPIRRQQIQLLDDLIADCVNTHCDNNDLADLHFRKAELYALEQRYYRLETMRVAIASDAAKTSGDKAKLARESAALARAAKTSLVSAVIVYKALADDDRFKNYANMPTALFYYGFMLGAGGYRTEMRDAYERLLRDYPQSVYVAEAHLAFADYHFENHQYADAASRYKRVLQFPKAAVYWYAKYKLGWVQLNLGRHRDALEAFHDVATGTKRDPDRAMLHRAAKNDIVRAYAEVGNVHRARDYFKKLDAAGGLALYELLADLLRDQGKSEKAIYAYRDLIGIAPANHNVCLWQHHVAQSMLTAGTNKDKVDEIEKLVRLYATVAGKKALPAIELADCKGLARDMAGDMARAWHSEWAKTRDLNTHALADRTYAIYLATFRGDAEFARTQYDHAELSWSRAERETRSQRLASQLWDDAATAFIAVVETGKVDRRTLEESARAVVLATVNGRSADPRADPADAFDPEAVPGDPDAAPRPRPIPDRDRKVLAAFDLYLASVKTPNNPEVIEMTLHKANLLRRYEHHADALPLLLDLVDHHRGHAVAEDAANFLLDSYNRLGRYGELVALAKGLAADAAFVADKPEMKRRLVAIEITAVRKAAERLEADGRRTGDSAKLVACGKAYAELYNRDTEAAGADELLFNAAVCFEDGKSVGIALEMYKKLEGLGERVREDIRARAVGRLGVAYGRVAYYQLAAKYLELYYAKYAGVKARKDLTDARAAISDAVIYRKGMGDDALAIKDTLLFVGNRDARPAEKAEAFFNLYAIYEKQADPAPLISHLRKYVSVHGAAGGSDRLVQAHARLGLALWTASCPVNTTDGACVKITRSRTLDAKRSGRRRLVQTQCGPGAKITVIERDSRKVREAMAAFARAVAEYERHGSGKAAGDRGAATSWYAVARLNALGPRYEAYLGFGFPTNLDFDPTKKAVATKSLARFDAWLLGKDTTAKTLKLAYQAVIAIGDPQNGIEAAARVGQIAQNASEAMFTAEIPANIRPYQEARELYCDTLTDKTRDLEALTIDAYTACLEQSTKLGWFSDWSRLCERELGQLKPGDYPLTTERRAPPSGSPVITDIEPRTAQLE
jgi:tetratricopeptide (TPR) repeat protein